MDTFIVVCLAGTVGCMLYVFGDMLRCWWFGIYPFPPRRR